MLNDKKRSKVPENTGFPTRLDEILGLLVQYGPSSTKYIKDAITSAASNSFDYTVECLVSAYKTLKTGEPLELDFQAELCLQRREAQRGTFEKEQSFQPSSEELKAEFNLLMFLREYKLVVQILDPTRFSEQEMDEFKSSILHDLAAGGFVFILRKIMNASAVAKLDDWEKRQQEIEPSSKEKTQPKKPLLLEACKGAVPNMETVRFLLEELRVDVNTQSMVYLEPGDGCVRAYMASKSALHYLMTENRWWQSALALPYLIKHGANTELRDHRGLTPLHAAVNQLQLNYISTRTAIKILVSHGVSPSSTDKWGEDCLAHARHDTSIFNLLVENGADITPSAFLSAIKEQNCEFIETVLSHGANPNMRFSTKQKDKTHERSIFPDEMYPIHYAARAGFTGAISEESAMKITKLLLNYGADPCAKYPYSTVTHEIICYSQYLEILIKHPPTKLDGRDPEGRTLLMRACRSLVESSVKMLLDRGVDIHAQDNDGRTAIYTLSIHERDVNPQILKLLVSKARDMVNIPDNKHQTPLYYALKHEERWHNKNSNEMTDILLSAGADPRLASETGETALHILATNDWVIGEDNKLTAEKRKIFERIVKMGADVNARDHLGETPLFKFFRSGDVKRILSRRRIHKRYTVRAESEEQMRATINETLVLEMFDKASMDWKVMNSAGFKFLLDKGVDVTVEDEQYRTALDIAAAQDAKDILDLFNRDSQVINNMKKEAGGRGWGFFCLGWLFCL
ncbi:hypothetical protein TWF281_004125 [Arthrobotrys megalospora]